jgi:hypothetical protein
MNEPRPVGHWWALRAAAVAVAMLSVAAYFRPDWASGPWALGLAFWFAWAGARVKDRRFRMASMAAAILSTVAGIPITARAFSDSSLVEGTVGVGISSLLLLTLPVLVMAWHAPRNMRVGLIFAGIGLAVWMPVQILFLDHSQGDLAMWLTLFLPVGAGVFLASTEPKHLAVVSAS